MDPAARAWLDQRVAVTGRPAATHRRPWAVVWRVPVSTGQVWFKQCAPVQAFEPALTIRLAADFPQLLPQVLASDIERRWLLLADAGAPVRRFGNRPEFWVDVLPRYAELQRDQARRVDEHLAAGVPDLRLELLPARYGELLAANLPCDREKKDAIARLEPSFARWCVELADHGIPATVQHDDLHHSNLFVHNRHLRILDWGDTVISHPFASLVVTFQFLEEVNGLAPDDPCFLRLRRAYLEPWGSGHEAALSVALRVGAVAHAISWLRQREALPESWLPRFDAAYQGNLDRVARLADD
jgi:phosphotransferase family enzyme